MTERFFEYKTTLAAFAVTVPFAATVWLLAVTHTMSAVTFVALALIAMGSALVAVNTWRNGETTGTIGRVLNGAQATAAIRPAPTTAPDARRRV